MKNVFILILCACLMMYIGFYLSHAGQGHEENDPLHHDDLGANAEFFWIWGDFTGDTPNYNPFRVTWLSQAYVDAPSNADGDFEIYAWVLGDNMDSLSEGYLGGTSKRVKSAVARNIGDPAPSLHSENATITGTFLTGSPGNIILHTNDPLDHLIASDR